jgi:hypothetical protein
MSRLCISTRGIGSWRARLANPDRQWKRGFSAFETAVSWELACKSISGLPEPVEKLFCEGKYGEPRLMFAVAEHKVDLPGGNAASQSDVWAVVKTSRGMFSLTIEAKAKEAFGDEMLEKWLIAGETKRSIRNREKRWEHVRKYLPKSESFFPVRYQMLHRCAASVIEAERLGFRHAGFIVQAFKTSPDKSFQDYAAFCRALNIHPKRGKMATTSVGDITLNVGWIDCPLATDKEVAASA